MRVRLQKDHCQGHGLCVAVSPDVFKLDSDDTVPSVAIEDVGPDREAEVLLARDSCPVGAIHTA